MKKITNLNKQLALDIARNAFFTNPSMRWFLKSPNDEGAQMLALCDYCVSSAMYKHGAYLTDDNNGIVLAFPSHAQVSWLQQVRLTFNLITKGTGWLKLFAMMRRQNHVQKMRGDGEYLYVLLIASNHENGVQTAIEIKNHIFQQARDLNLPVYAETSSKGNKIIYERYGFKMYDTYRLPGTETILWFMKREDASVTPLTQLSKMSLAV